MPRLEQWSVVLLEGGDAYTPPELWPRGLHGVVTGHSKMSDGSYVVTSEIQRLVREGNEATVYVHSGTGYVLGTVDPEWERQYPNAGERFLKSLGARR